jgi:aspartate/methionine/tyrosine aminotransferase
VLVDEVYLDALFDASPLSSYHLGPEFITTNSLTKVYGLSGLRCGWILAEPALCRRIWRMNDVFGVIPSHTAELLSIVALENLPRVAAWAKQVLDTNRAVLNSFLARTNQVSFPELEAGTVVFPRTSLAVEPFCAYLREKYETSVVPGHFFGADANFRIGIGGDADMLNEGLARLHQALAEFPSNA